MNPCGGVVYAPVTIEGSAACIARLRSTQADRVMKSRKGNYKNCHGDTYFDFYIQRLSEVIFRNEE